MGCSVYAENAIRLDGVYIFVMAIKKIIVSRVLIDSLILCWFISEHPAFPDNWQYANHKGDIGGQTVSANEWSCSLPDSRIPDRISGRLP